MHKCPSKFFKLILVKQQRKHNMKFTVLFSWKKLTNVPRGSPFLFWEGTTDIVQEKVMLGKRSQLLLERQERELRWQKVNTGWKANLNHLNSQILHCLSPKNQWIGGSLACAKSGNQSMATYYAELEKWQQRRQHAHKNRVTFETQTKIFWKQRPNGEKHPWWGLLPIKIYEYFFIANSLSGGRQPWRQQLPSKKQMIGGRMAQSASNGTNI